MACLIICQAWTRSVSLGIARYPFVTCLTLFLRLAVAVLCQYRWLTLRWTLRARSGTCTPPLSIATSRYDQTPVELKLSAASANHDIHVTIINPSRQL